MSVDTKPLSLTCLFIINKHFYSFEKHIREALTSFGYNVTVSNDEYPEGVIGRIIGKLQVPIIFPITYKQISEKYLEGKRYDLILIIKGRGMSARLIKKMNQHSNHVVGYNWDSFKLNRSPLRWYKFTNRYFTFDYRDAAQYHLPVVELYSASKAIAQSKTIKYDISAIVRNHSGRLKYIDKILTTLQPATSFIFIYENSKISYFINFIKNPKLFFKYKKFISFKPLKYEEYSDAINSSAFTIDFAHHTQTGITMRCFESINAKTKIITNSKYLQHSKHFNDSNSVVFDGFDTQKLQQNYIACMEKTYISEPRTITDFIRELIEP